MFYNPRTSRIWALLLLLSFLCRPQARLNNGDGSDAWHKKPRKTEQPGFSTTHTSRIAQKTRSVRGSRSLAETLFNYRTLVCTLSATCNTEVQKQNSHWWVRNPCWTSAAVFHTANKPVARTLHADKQRKREWASNWTKMQQQKSPSMSHSVSPI